ncbi:hypothetical protein GCM10010174_07730 [Kutzneria viridogrisea]
MDMSFRQTQVRPSRFTTAGGSTRVGEDVWKISRYSSPGNGTSPESLARLVNAHDPNYPGSTDPSGRRLSMAVPPAQDRLAQESNNLPHWSGRQECSDRSKAFFL